MESGRITVNISVTILPLLLLLFSGCKKPEPPVFPPSPPELPSGMVIRYTSDKGPFVADGVLRYDQAGLPYSITKCCFYLSGITLNRDDGQPFMLCNWLYGDATEGTQTVSLQRPASGTYTSVSLSIGLDSAQNKSFSLPPNEENLNMQWPEPMGGGYHFLMLEGHFDDSTGRHGFALHLGRNHTRRTVTMPVLISCEENEEFSLLLELHVNEWLRTPHLFDFRKNVLHIMGNDSLMSLVADNGADAIRIAP